MTIIRRTRLSVRRRRERRARIIEGALLTLGFVFVVSIITLTLVGATICAPNESVVQCLAN